MRHSQAARISAELGAPALGRPIRGWQVGLAVAATALLLGVGAVSYMFITGVGVWGVNNSVGWAYAITSFVFWIGLGHAGTLISAVLLLLRQDWRVGVHRAAETMTVIAILCAAVFPVMHLGRPWLFGWMLPLPNDRGPLSVNFSSALTWDVFAIFTYLAVSVLFWYLGLLPDLAGLRAAATGVRRRIFRVFSLGWTGSRKDWAYHRTATRLIAGLATALVVSVHSVVGLDFATTVVPGWHTTIFPPYFVVGAIFSGMAMVLVLCIALRPLLGVRAYMTQDHIEALCKLMLAASCFVGLAYAIEALMPLYSGHRAELHVMLSRVSGEAAPLYWSIVTLNAIAPQLLWSAAVRRNTAVVLALSLGVLIGMWLERFMIVVTTQETAFLPSGWTDYSPTIFEVAMLVGSVGLFVTLFLLACRIIPMVSVNEMLARQGQEEP